MNHTRVAWHALIGLVVWGMVGVVSPAGGQTSGVVFDHLQCFSIKVPHPTLASADLVPLDPAIPVQPFCRLRGPYLACMPVEKTNVMPPAPGAPDGPREGYHLCYKFLCKDPLPAPMLLRDQFGTFGVSFRKAQMVCTPALRPQSFPTTTTSTTVTTTVTTSTLAGGSPSAAFVASTT